MAKEIQYLKPGFWLGNHSIDRYLRQCWLQVKDWSPVLYLNTYHLVLCSQEDSPTSEECKTVRRQLLLPEDGAVPMRPVTFILHNDETRHYFTVAMNYERLHVTTYGRNYKIEKSHYATEPMQWAGPHIWRNICIIFNWAIPEERPTWWAIDWKQVRLFLEICFISSLTDLFRMVVIAVQYLSHS